MLNVVRRSQIIGWIAIDSSTAAPFGGRAVLYPEDVEEIAIDKVIIREDVKPQFEAESEGLNGLFSDKSQQVQHLVNIIGVGFARRSEKSERFAVASRWRSLSSLREASSVPRRGCRRHQNFSRQASVFGTRILSKQPTQKYVNS